MQNNSMVNDFLMKRLKDKSRQTTLLALLTTLPIMVIVLISTAAQVSSFFDPCLTWGYSNGGALPQPEGRCSTGVRATSDTIQIASLRLILAQGAILAAIVVGVLGVRHNNRKFLVTASIILFAESIPLIFNGAFLLTLLPAVFFLWSARKSALKDSEINNEPIEHKQIV
jgi:hypothetical protein